MSLARDCSSIPVRILLLPATTLPDTPPAEGFIAYENTTVVPSLVGKAHGKVVEIGTGPGNQIERYNPLLVERIYGVDPNSRFATAIAARLKQHPALADKYRFIACGIEDTDILATEGISPGTIDTVVSIQSLCAVNDVKGVMRQAHRLLKPGGSFIFWEHEKSRDTVTGIAQGESTSMIRKLPRADRQQPSGTRPGAASSDATSTATSRRTSSLPASGRIPARLKPTMTR
jgi:SAM-dependent methyltransferase